MNTINIFKNKRIIPAKLTKYGFKKFKDTFSYETDIYNGEFTLKITIQADDLTTYTELKEKATGEEYTLHLVEDAQGEFVGQIKEKYKEVLDDIKSKCFETGIFEWNYSYRVIDYCKKKYKDEMEYLWEKFPRNGVCRRKDNKKWYLAILSVKAEKLGYKTDEIYEVLDLRAPVNEIPQMIKQRNIYPAYHMNKKSWITIILDGSVNIEEIYKKIDTSYELALKK